MFAYINRRLYFLKESAKGGEVTGKSRSMLLEMLTDDFEDDDQSSDVEFITTPTHSDHEEDVKTQEEASKIEEDLKSEKQDKGTNKEVIPLTQRID